MGLKYKKNMCVNTINYEITDTSYTSDLNI
jgi:hypothetical protein